MTQWLVLAFGGPVLANQDISSDSLAMYAWCGVLWVASAVLSALLRPRQREALCQWAFRLLPYFLSLHLLKYGWDKVFKWQFPLPEPNILYTPLGHLDKDILFWSSMGISRPYNIFLGLMEVLPALLILFRTGQRLGLWLAVGVLAHVVAINFCFDISVKIFSCLLLGIAVFLLVPDAGPMARFFLGGKGVFALRPRPLWPKPWHGLFLLLILAESLYPYVRSGSFNDDQAARPYLHGAYQFQKASLDGREVSLERLGLRRVFIHRRGYVVFQYPDDSMQDFRLSIDTARRVLLLMDYDTRTSTLPYEYDAEQGVLMLQFPQGGLNYQLEAQVLHWEKMPALQPLFHWTPESVE